MAFKITHLLKLVLEQLAVALLAIIIGLTLPPILILVIPIIYILRSFVKLLAKILRPDYGPMVTSRSSVMIAEDSLYSPEHKMSLAILVLLEGFVDLKEMYPMFQRNAMEALDSEGNLAYPELKQNVVSFLGFHFWKDVKDFKLEDHVYYYERPGSTSSSPKEFEPMTEVELNELAKSLSLKPFSPSKGLWEGVFVPAVKLSPSKGPSDKIYSAVIYREHHCLADGISSYKLMQSVSFTKNKFHDTHNYTGNQAKKESSDYAITKMSFLSKLALPFKMSYDLANFAVTSASARNVWKIHDVDDCKSFSQASTELLDFADIKTIRDRHDGVGCTSVVVSAVTGAIRDTMFQEKKIPDRILLAFPLPLPNHPEKLRNYMTSTTLSIPVGIKDPLDRLWKVHHSMKALKSSTLPIFTSWGQVLIGSLFPAILNPLFHWIASGQHFAFLSNFAGPKEPNDVFGRRVVGINCSTSMVASYNSLFITFITDGGSARLTVSARRDILKSDLEAQKFICNFLNQLDILRNIPVKHEPV